MLMGKTTVDQRARMNGGFLGGPMNPANREARVMQPSVKPEDPEAGPPNLRIAEDPEQQCCGKCVFHDGEMCEAHQTPCSAEQVCDDFTADEGEGEAGESMDSEDD